MSDAVVSRPVTARPSWRPGVPVAVRNRYTRSWAPGFEIHAAAHDAFRVRRRSDGAVLPRAFPVDDLRLT